MAATVSRDRLSRPVDISTLLDGATRKVNLIVDNPGLRRVGLSGHGFRNPSENGGAHSGSVESRIGVQRPSNDRGHVHQTTLVGPRRNGGQGRRGPLPGWYPRTPLRDITSIMRAIERRRAELGLYQDSEAPQGNNNAANPQVDQELVVSTPMPTTAVKPRLSPGTKLSIMEANNAEWNVDSSEALTPQKKLLNSIEKVMQVWVDQQLKLKKTPTAKRLERENKVRVLMSMR